MTITAAPTTRTDLVILRAWRDGSVHAEIPFAAFPGDDGEVNLHAEDPKSAGLFTTLCGQKYWGKTSATGWGNPAKVNCDECRKLLLGA